VRLAYSDNEGTWVLLVLVLLVLRPAVWEDMHVGLGGP
jgi:hypothetical protein